MKTRIISAIIMALIAIPLLLIGGLPFKIFAMVLGVMSMYEIMNIRKKNKESKPPKLLQQGKFQSPEGDAHLQPLYAEEYVRRKGSRCQQG